jgi:hypothetical protein
MASTPEVSADMLAPLTPDELRKIDAYWHACNYLSAGMIYLRANPLLREPLKPEHIKNRLLGHWGSDPGQSLIWVHLNRLIKKYDLNVMYITIPRSIPTRVVMKLACSSSSSSFRFPEGSVRTVRRRLPVRFTKAASWAIPSLMHTEPLSTILISSLPLL